MIYVCGDIYRLLDDVEMGGGDTQGHGMVLALHMLMQLKSSQKLSELLTKKYDSICRWLHCLQPIHKQLTVKHFCESQKFYRAVSAYALASYSVDCMYY